MNYETNNPQTLAVHHGFDSDPTTGAVTVPIYQSAAFTFENTEHAADLFALKQLGNIYTRVQNPTCDVLEQRIAAMEGGAAAMTTASGQSAITFSLLNIAQVGDNIVSSTDLYGGSWNLFSNTLPTMGVEVRFVDPADPDAFRKATDERTRAYFAETLPNPKLDVFPIAEVATIGEELGVPLIVDNTAAPVICRPFDHGAHIIVYSATKYIGGHGTSIGGLIVDGGRFDWERHAARFPMLNQPDPSYHGAVWTEATKEMGPVAYIVKARCTLQHDLGAPMSPFNAFQFLQGLETLPIRMREHCRNAQVVADFLAGRKDVTRVIHPAHSAGEVRRRARSYLTGGFGGLVGFEMAEGAEAGRQFIDNLTLAYHCANIGDARTLAIHPASTTHSQLTADEQAATGVTPGYVRLAVGIEDVVDIIGDISQALDAVTIVKKAA